MNKIANNFHTKYKARNINISSFFYCHLVA
ncbi:30S ribosomal protein S21 [Rickettsia rickettsii str. Hlp|uniref:30S ribosomal protein S21 n=1 Tax=Rickettsia philipii (strain 364D) TaxID=481009 RepID=H6PUM6_RICP3|nr:30S ribosomal protein S21 [Rickettsia philipii str. 364D]AFB29234.1 30S ribosomal protein S21 [Rickettsia rickettsii str. Hlp\